MNTDKQKTKLIYSLICAAASFFILYLLRVYITSEIDPRKWNEAGRFFHVLVFFLSQAPLNVLIWLRGA